jgi:hypothetical protein
MSVVTPQYSRRGIDSAKAVSVKLTCERRERERGKRERQSGRERGGGPGRHKSIRFSFRHFSRLVGMRKQLCLSVRDHSDFEPLILPQMLFLPATISSWLPKIFIFPHH